jgi:hypothetical protein
MERPLKVPWLRRGGQRRESAQMLMDTLGDDGNCRQRHGT